MISPNFTCVASTVEAEQLSIQRWAGQLRNMGSFPSKVRDFSLCHNTQPLQHVLGGGALSFGIKQLGCETDHSPPSSADIKNVWSYISTLERLHDIVLNRTQKQLYLYCSHIDSSVIINKPMARQFLHSRQTVILHLTEVAYYSQIYYHTPL
jgi:hypothetical protein